MNILNNCVDFFMKNAKKIIISGCVVSSGVIAVHYLKKYSIEWQYNKINNLLKETHRRDQFQMIESLTKRLTVEYLNYVKLNLENLFKERNDLLSKKSKQLNKVEFMDSVKTNLFIDVFLMMYSSALFIITLKIWHHIFRGNCINSPKMIRDDFKEKFTLIFNSVLVNAIKRLNKNLEINMKKYLTKLNIQQEYELRDIELLISELHLTLSNNCKPFEYFIQEMYKKFEKDFQDPFANIIFSEINDLLRSIELENLFDSCLRITDSVFIDEIFELYIPLTGQSTSSKKTLSNCDQSVVLYKLLPKIDSMLKNKQFFTSLISQLLICRNLKTFENNLMESYYFN